MERRGADAGRRVGLPPGVKRRARLISGRVLVRGIASPAEEVPGHENGDHHHQGRQDDFNMHFCSHPGVNGRLSHEAGTACLPCSLSCHEARPGVPMPNSSRYPGNICGFAFTRRIRHKTRPDRVQLQDPAAGRTLAAPHYAPHYAPQVPRSRTAHGGNTGIGPGYREQTPD